MKARLYVNSRYLGEIDMSYPMIDGGKVREVGIADKVTVAFVRDHPEHGGERAMFVHGVVERV